MPAAHKDAITAAFRGVQDQISAFLSGEDKPFREDAWDYASGQGGGVTRTWEDGSLLEKGGVGFSAITGTSLPPAAATQFKIAPGTSFYATGVSLVMHPRNPHVPTIHMNVRYFEAGDSWWFGGGVDLTPYYPEQAQVVGFHRALRGLCDSHGRDYGAMLSRCGDLERREQIVDRSKGTAAH